jgi:hypothetical protein
MKCGRGSLWMQQDVLWAQRPMAIIVYAPRGWGKKRADYEIY